MKLITKMLTVSGLFLTLIPVSAAEKIEQSIDVLADGIVDIVNVRGQISVLGWDKNQVLVKGQLDEQAKQFIFENDGKLTTIKVVLPNRVHRGSGSELVIQVPRNSEINFEGVSTDISVTDIGGGVRLSSVSGDITVSKVGHLVEVNSVSGQVKVHDSQGRLVASSVSGDMELDVDSDDVELDSVSANIRFKTLKEISSLKLNTVSGAASIDCPVSKRGDVNFSSVSGKIDLNIDGDVNARFDLSTAPGGEITNQVSEDLPKRSFVSSQELSFKQGEGSALIKGNTLSGNLVISHTEKQEKKK